MFDWWDKSAVINFISPLYYRMKKDSIQAALFGLAVGDAVGVPVEFRSRQGLNQNPVVDMQGYGTHNQPPGTWSDDSSLAFCLAEALCGGFDLKRLADNFIRWRYEDWWTPHGYVFDIGITTSAAIGHLRTGTRPDLAGGFDESENGNGSLMRILPLLFYSQYKSIDERYVLTKQVSSITHGHIRSVIACFYYLEYARLLIQGMDKMEAYQSVKSVVNDYLNSQGINNEEVAKFNRLLEDDIWTLKEDDIQSSGYVLHSLEASLWCLLTTNNYKEAVLNAVNLGQDTDTTGAITGGLAGLLYGFENIPKEWLAVLARKGDIEDLANRFLKRLNLVTHGS